MFVFVKLANGSYVVNVRSTADEPYYLPLDIVVKLPLARPTKSLWAQPPVWTGIPDLVLADPAKLLDDPEQTAAYQAQRAQTLLLPRHFISVSPRFHFGPWADHGCRCAT